MNTVNIPSPPEKKRGVGLTLWLIILLLGNIQASLVLFIYGVMVSRMPEVFRMSPLVNYVLSFVAFLNIVFLIFLFRWKKWAFFAFCGGYFLVAIITFMALPFLSLVFTAGAVITLGILYLLLRPKWKFLE